MINSPEIWNLSNRETKISVLLFDTALRELGELQHVWWIISTRCILEHIITELHYLLSYLHGVEAVHLLVGLHSNKKDLIASNDKAETPVPDAIIKSGLINQTRA